jgi:hypothetical protein
MKKIKVKIVFMLIVMLGVSFCGIASAATWDLNTEMNASIGDNGIWSYGYAEWDPDDPNKVAYQGLLENWGPSGGTNNIWAKDVNGALPHIFVGPLVGVPLGFHGMNGGTKTVGDDVGGDVPVVIRWTAPDTIVTPTNISIDGWFQPVSSGAVEVIIVKSVAGDPNQQSILLHETDVNNAEGVNFSLSCTVTADDTIDFMLGAKGSRDNDWTTLKVIITDEPKDPTVSPWVLNTDMDTSVNDNGIWSYGYGDPNMTAYAGLVDDVHVIWAGTTRFIWMENSNVVQISMGPTTDGIPVPVGVHSLNPGNDGSPAIIRWTAPDTIVTPTNMIVDASLQPVSAGTVDVKIVKSIAGDAGQQTILDEKYNVTNGTPFTLLMDCTVTAGDTIDFMVGPAGPSYQDWTATSISISEGVLTCVTYLPMDFNEDCYVNLDDFAIFAQSWLDCNDQSNPNCEYE